jgi:uncharacterized protein YjiS (DUF1127 family)
MHVARVTPTAAAASTLTPRGAVAAAPLRRGPAPGSWPAWMGAVLSRVAERRQLLALEQRDMRDIGLSRAEVLALARKPLWQR